MEIAPETLRIPHRILQFQWIQGSNFFFFTVSSQISYNLDPGTSVTEDSLSLKGRPILYLSAVFSFFFFFFKNDYAGNLFLGGTQ